MVHNPEFHQRTKHIDVKYHFIRNVQEEGVINVSYVNTENEIADIMTKALNGPRFQRLKNEMGLNAKSIV